MTNQSMQKGCRMQRPNPVGGFLLALFILGTAGCTAAAKAGGHVGIWSQDQSPARGSLNGIACPDARMCVAVGDTSIVTTRNRGKTWRSTTQHTGRLRRVSCPSIAVCYAVGQEGVILGTADGGRIWRNEASGTTADLAGVACPSTTICYVVGDQRVPCLSMTCKVAFGDQTDVLTTRDGGRTWRNRNLGVLGKLANITCPSTERCYAAAAGGGDWTTTNGAATWKFQPDPSTGETLTGISCPTQITCYKVGTEADLVQVCTFGEDGCYQPGLLTLATTDGGETWDPKGQAESLNVVDLACPSTILCSAVGENGTILATKDGGRTWHEQDSGTTQNLLGIACPSTTACYAVGDEGTILSTQ